MLLWLFSGEFDMRVKSCAASDGSEHVIQLSDEYGCVLRPKMISRYVQFILYYGRAENIMTFTKLHMVK